MGGRSLTDVARSQPVLQQGVRGIETNAVWWDDMPDHTADAMSYAMSGLTTGPSPPQQVKKKRVVDPLEIICARCKAAAGERCTDTNRRKTFERKPHRRRKDDARRAQEAVNAML